MNSKKITHKRSGWNPIFRRALKPLLKRFFILRRSESSDCRLKIAVISTAFEVQIVRTVRNVNSVEPRTSNHERDAKHCNIRFPALYFCESGVPPQSQSNFNSEQGNIQCFALGSTKFQARNLKLYCFKFQIWDFEFPAQGAGSQHWDNWHA